MKIRVAETIKTRRSGKKAKPQKSVRGTVTIRKVSKKGDSMASKLIKELACSVADPFSCSACIPDGSTNTGCFSIKQQFSLGTGSGGTCSLLALQPDPANFTFSFNNGTTTTPTVTGSWSSCTANTTVVAQYDVVRPVSLGIKFSYIGNTQTDQGQIVVGQLAAEESLGTLNGASVTNLCNALSSYEVFPLRGGATITWRPETMDDQANWLTTGTGGSQSVSTGGVRPVLVLACFSTNSSATQVGGEIVANFEGQFAINSFLPGGLKVKTDMPIAAPGWYEIAKNLYNKVEPYLPFVLSAFGSPTSMAASMLMGNGMRYALNQGIGSRRM